MSRKFLSRVLVFVSSIAVSSTLLIPLSAPPADAAVPSMRQTNYLSPTANVANRYFGSSVATDAAGSRMVVGESGTSGIGGEVNVYDCTSSGCSLS